MTDTNILLSICIPTYNRAWLLKQTLESIVRQDVFVQTNEVEVIISDNCSDDETESVAQDFANNFPEKIKYSRSATNVGPETNFELALSHGSGAFMKLHNDNLLVRNGALVEMLKIIRATEAEKPILFFANGGSGTAGPFRVCNNFNEFVLGASFISTWIGAFGIWRDQFNAIPDFLANAQLRIVQTDILFRLLATGKRAIIIYENYFEGLSPGRKRYEFNQAEIFGTNYISLLKKYVDLGFLSSEIFELEKKTVLLRFTIPGYFNRDHDFQKNGFFEHMQDYKNDDYFYKAIEDFIWSLVDNRTAHP